MPNPTKFQDSWLLKTDSSGVQLKEWCKADSSSPYKAYCIICCKTIQCDNSGVKQLLHHAYGKKHSDAAKARFGKNQSHLSKNAATTQAPQNDLSSEGPSSASTTREHSTFLLQSPSVQEKVANAEILWALKVAQSNFSYNSCEGISSLFKKMFPGDVSEHFSMSKSKISYLLSDGLGPNFRKEMCSTINETKCAFTLQYDETANSQNRKQCDLLIRYWCEVNSQVCVGFLKALMFGHAKGKDVASSMIEALQEEGYQLPLRQMISLGSDGPNVNKTIWTAINEHMKESGLHGILPFIPCNLHVVHNAFRKGLDVFGGDAEQLILDLFYFLKASPCRKEDFLETQLDLGLDEQMVIKHVQSRWLTLIPAVKRVLKQWEAVQKYFVVELPRIAAENKVDKSLKNNDRYKRICQNLRDPAVLVQLPFIQNLEAIFTRFLTLFQKEEPLIHILYHGLSELLRTVMLRFLKASVVGEKTGKKLLLIELSKSENQLNDQSLEIGATTRNQIWKKIKTESQVRVIKDMRQFYVSITEYLRSHVPVGKGIVKDLACLNPVLQKADKSICAIQRTAKKLPQVISEEELPLLSDEWKIYQGQDIPEDWYITGHKDDGTVEYRRVDHYWQKVFEQKNIMGKPRYQVLQKLIKAVLCLAHGNAEVERSLSENKRMLTSERTLLSDSSVNGLRCIKDAIRVNGSGQAHLMPITPAMREARRSANRVYLSRIVEERKAEQNKERVKKQKTAEVEEMRKMAKVLEAKKKSLEEKDSSISKEQSLQEEELCKAETLYHEVKQRLERAIKAKDIDQLVVIQGLMDVASKQMASARKKLEDCRKELNIVGAKRRKVSEQYSAALEKMVKYHK